MNYPLQKTTHLPGVPTVFDPVEFLKQSQEVFGINFLLKFILEIRLFLKNAISVEILFLL